MQTLAPPSPNQLVDRFGRRINYVRISVTDRCDFRCVYCMPRDMRFLPRDHILSTKEIELIAESMVELGVDKIRITGGEPLVRKNITQLFRSLGQKSGLKDLTLTTNGSQLKKYAPELKDAGVTRINISLDTLKPGRFKQITRIGELQHTLEGIKAAIACNFERIKINSVIMKNYNHDEIYDLTQFAIDHSIDISFIEEMPLGENNDHDRQAVYYSSDEVLADLQQRYALSPSLATTPGPSRYYQLTGNDNTRVGFISPHSHNFCSSCNRVRMTAEGRLLLCLGQEHSVDLRQVVRRYPGDKGPIKQALIKAMDLKPKGHEFYQTQNTFVLRHMNMTGG
jgi:cyclic pyranopterin phosphate synthase